LVLGLPLSAKDGGTLLQTTLYSKANTHEQKQAHGKTKKWLMLLISVSTDFGLCSLAAGMK
jgi:hypothetical protein